MEAFCWWRRGGGKVVGVVGVGGGGFGGPQGDLLSVGFSLFCRAELNIIIIAHTRSFSFC